MQPALDALDRGVQQLFARPARRRSLQYHQQQHHNPQHVPPTPSAAASTRAQHPLCECLALQPLPDDWLYLRRHPVLKRHMLSRWQELCDQYDNSTPQQAQNKPITSLSAVSSSVPAAYARRRATVVQSVNALCVLLYQCGLLHVHEIEFVRLLVSKTLARGLGDVLLLMREGHVSELPLRVRMLLLHVVLEQVVVPAATQKSNSCTNNKRELQAEISTQRLTEDLCMSLQEDVLEAMTNKRARGRTRAVGATPSRMNASPGGMRTAERRESGKSSAVAPVCEFCRQAEDQAAAAGALVSSPWIELQRLSSTVQEVLDGVENGKLFLDENTSTTVSKLAGLRNLLARSDVKARLATRDSARFHLQSATQPFENNSSSNTLQQQWTLSVKKYEQIRWSTLSSSPSTLQTDSATATDVNMVLWGNVWERELQRFAPAKQLRVCDIILHCAKADFFTRLPSFSSTSINIVKTHRSSKTTASLPGYRLICQVLRALQVDCFTAVLLFLQAWTSTATLGSLSVAGSRRHSQMPVSSMSTTRASNSIAAVCQSYLEQLLRESERRVWLEAEDDNPVIRLQGKTNSAETPVNGEQLVELLHSLYTIFADALVCDDDRGSQRPPYCRHWDRILLLAHPVDGSTDSDKHSASLSWLNALVLCCKQLYDNPSGEAPSFQQHRAFKTAFASYVQRIVRSIVVENGRSISSGAGGGGGSLFREPLVRTENDLQFVRESVSSILVSTVSGEGRESSWWISGLIVQLLQTQMCHRSRAWSMGLELTYRRGLEQLFFPALAAVIKAICRDRHSDIQGQGRMKAIEEEENRYFAILSQVSESLKARYGSHVIATALLGFCTDWDAYQLKIINNTRERRRTIRRLWGRASLLRLHPFTDILRIYESESALAEERGEVVQFLGDVLQSVTNCPPALEGKLFQVLSNLKSRLEKRPFGGSGGGALLPLSIGEDSQESELVAPPLALGTAIKQIGPISHSSDPLAKFMHQLHTGTILHVREAVEKVKSDPQALEDLIQHVSRWVALMRLNDPQAAFGKETKLSFTVLCNRLMCWLPDEMIYEIRQAVTPVDQDLIYALTAFAESYGSHHEDEYPMGISTGSSVRLELLIRSFVYSFVVPDLCELTDIVMNAIIGCTSTKSRDALMKMTQRISSVLLVEVAIETLRLSLSTECLSYLDRASQHDHHHHHQQDMIDNHDESVNRLSNALSIVGLSSALFSSHDISWSASLFDEQAVQHWLLCFFDCIVYSEQSRALTPVDELLSSLEFLMQQSPNGERMAQHSYLLVALLCTASFPQSRIPQALWSDFDTSLLEITQAILVVLSPPRVSSGTIQEDNDCEVLFVQVHPLRVVRTKVSEESMELGSELFVKTSSAALTKRFQNGYLDEQEPDNQANNEGIRVFVRFSTWLASAIIYSQSIAAALTTNNNGSGEGDAWEQAFADYLVYLYLPLEFGNSVSRLLGAWVSVWMRMDLEQQLAAGENGDSLDQLLLVLPFQQKLFSRLSATRPPQCSEDQSPTDPVWELVFTSASKVLEDVSNAPDAVDAAIIVLDDVIAKFDLLNLSTMMISGEEVFTQTELLAHEFEALCSHQSMALLSDIQTIHVLKYPLELVAFCHITTLERQGDLGYVTLPVSPHQWDLERVLTALGPSIHAQEEEPSSPSSSSDTENGHEHAMQLSEEMTAFWYEWTQMIQLKYAYLDPTRCEQFILAATYAVSGQALAQSGA